MKMNLRTHASKASRLAIVAIFSTVLAACGGSGTGVQDPLATVDNPNDIDANDDGLLNNQDDHNGDGVVDATDEALFLVNPNFVDANLDGNFDANDDIDGDGFVDQDDIDAFDNPDPDPDGGNIEPDCLSRVCDGASGTWADYANVAQNQSPKSPYALGIQRILWCTGFGGDSTFEAFTDGIYGPGTAAAVREYQEVPENGLVADGIVGPATWTSLQGNLAGPFNVAGDASLNSWTVLSAKPECDGVDMFYEDATGFTLEGSPGDGIIDQSPFSVNEVDLP